MQPIADDDTIAGACQGVLTLIQAGRSTTYRTDGYPQKAAISADGSTVVYDSWDNGRGTRLYALDRASGRETFLYEDPDSEDANVAPAYPDLFQASVSDDGRLALILARDPASSRRQWLLTMNPTVRGKTGLDMRRKGTRTRFSREMAKRCLR